MEFNEFNKFNKSFDITLFKRLSLIPAPLNMDQT